MSDLARMLINLFVLYAAARLAGALFERLQQPAVVGELLAGVVVGPHALNLLLRSPALTAFNNLFADLGIVFLLFVVGLQTEPASLWRVGRDALRVSVLGVSVSFGLGYLLMRAWHYPLLPSLFLATALSATSVAITARVLKDMRALGARVANVIVGAAVLDDVIGILVLTVVAAMAAGASVGSNLLLLLLEAGAFVVLTIFLGRPAVHRLAPRMARADAARDPVFALAVTLCFAFSALAEVIGLAAIIGAFFAGIIFAETREAPRLRTSMEPIYELLVPIFFVLMGAQVNLHALGTGTLLGLGLLVAGAAALGKIGGCGLGALPMGRTQALTVGVGMMPRGEVAVVVASVGLGRGIVSPDVYSIIVLMCVLTTIVTPPLLRPLLLARKEEVVEEGPGMEGRP